MVHIYILRSQNFILHAGWVLTVRMLCALSTRWPMCARRRYWTWCDDCCSPRTWWCQHQCTGRPTTATSPSSTSYRERLTPRRCASRSTLPAVGKGWGVLHQTGEQCHVARGQGEIIYHALQSLGQWEAVQGRTVLVCSQCFLHRNWCGPNQRGLLVRPCHCADAVLHTRQFLPHIISLYWHWHGLDSLPLECVCVCFGGGGGGVGL